MFMPNIPRRKIYETLLEYEDTLIEMQIMLHTEENFKKFSEQFNQEGIKKLRESYRKIKGLLIMFLNNKKFSTKEKFEKELNQLLTEEKKSNWKIFKNRNFPVKFKYLSYKLDNIFKNTTKIDSHKHGKELFKIFDAFNHFIPKILELRRDKMK